MAGFSFDTQDIGTVLPFNVTEKVSSTLVAGTVSNIPLNLTGSVVTMHTDDGRVRLTSLVETTVGLAEYTTSASDFPSQTFQQGRLRVTMAPDRVFHTETFDIHVEGVSF